MRASSAMKALNGSRVLPDGRAPCSCRRARTLPWRNAASTPRTLLVGMANMSCVSSCASGARGVVRRPEHVAAEGATICRHATLLVRQYIY
ncbi:Uncharacterised protein [Bordetella pertussis]|nr:Uncharacterised protein [Bordetella pertussis]